MDQRQVSRLRKDDGSNATDAALNYLQKLHDDFNSWELALAAYNCGEGCVARAIAWNQKRKLPTDYLSLYQSAGAAYAVPWTVLAAIGAIESDHGRSSAPGVQSGVNTFGCCAGPMQFNVRNGPPSTVQTYRVDGNDTKDAVVLINSLGTDLRLWEPQMEAYVTRALNPTAAPSYGVPGER